MAKQTRRQLAAAAAGAGAAGDGGARCRSRHGPVHGYPRSREMRTGNLGLLPAQERAAGHSASLAPNVRRAVECARCGALPLVRGKEGAWQAQPCHVQEDAASGVQVYLISGNR